MPDSVVSLESRRAAVQLQNAQLVTCGPAPLPEQLAVVEIPTVIVIGPVIPATVPTSG